MIEQEVVRIRELSKCGRHSEALAAAEELAVAAPHNRDALYLIAANQRCLNQIDEALATLQRLEQQHPRFSLLYQERGYCHTSLRDAPLAIEAFLEAVNLNPALATSWTMLERLYHVTGQLKGAAMAAEQVSILEQLPPEVARAGSLFSDGQLSTAENILREYLSKDGNHVEAMRLLARIEHQLHALEDAEERIETVLKLAPNYRAARLDYVSILLDQQKYLRAHEVIDTMLKLEPNTNDKYLLSLCAAACVGLGRNKRAIELYRQLLATSPESFGLHVALGHALQSIGRQEETIESYRRAAAIRPSFGDAYWSLANLKTYRFSQDEIGQMRAEEAKANPTSITLIATIYASHWAKHMKIGANMLNRGNSMSAATHSNAPKAATVQRLRKRTRDDRSRQARRSFFRRVPASEQPIRIRFSFSVCLVRDQRLLNRFSLLIRRSTARMNSLKSRTSFPVWIAAWRGVIRRCLQLLGLKIFGDSASDISRKLAHIAAINSSLSTKCPNNFRHIGLIHLMLPNAKIIDVRREPMACCFSNLKQLFASGQEFTYSVEDIAGYYRNYLELMRHWDAVLPGRVLTVWYEDIVEDLESNVCRILEFCNLKFEPACVEFYKLQRRVYTASSEQVRQRIFREGPLQWQNYKPWLGPLNDALADAVIRYRE